MSISIRMIIYLTSLLLNSYSYIPPKSVAYTIRYWRLRSTSIHMSTTREGVGKPKGYAGKTLKYELQNHTLSGLPYKSTIESLCSSQYDSNPRTHNNDSIVDSYSNPDREFCNSYFKASHRRPFTVLGIESSCDDTGVAIVRSDGTILSNVIYSQYEIHERFGGIMPGLAMEAHKTNIHKALTEAIAKAGLQNISDVDAIAATRGPGLEICLRVGYNQAKSLARQYFKPFVDVHHLEAHCLSSRLASITAATDSNQRFDYPILALIASGGHTSLIICKGLGKYDVLGGTRDDALGEAFDKAARILGIRGNMSGGAAMEILARKGNSSTYPMKVPMQRIRSCDFSYAGLKTSFRLMVENIRKEHGLKPDATNAPTSPSEQVTDMTSLPDDVTADLCASFQEAAIAHVINRIGIALDYVEKNKINLNGITIVGGVAANQYLRRNLLDLLKKRSNKNSSLKYIPVVFPPPNLCTDNGVMVAWAGIEKFTMGISDSVEEADVIPRWPLGSLVSDEVSAFAK